MIITVKNLQQQTFTVNFHPEKTVLELKETIFNERGSEYIVEKQKLIYAGVILSDDRTIASYNVDEKKFVVVMLKRDLSGSTPKKDESGSQSARASSANTSGGSGGSNISDASLSSSKTAQSDGKEVRSIGTTDEVTKPVGSDNNRGSSAPITSVDSNASILSMDSGASGISTTAVCGNSEPSPTAFSSGDLAGVFSNTSLQVRAESSLLMGEEYNRSVESMIEMGYGREMVERAMAASFNNPERAVEYLISGIPETDDQFNVATAAAGESALLRGAADVGAAVAAAAAGAGGSAGGVRSAANVAAPAATGHGAGSISSGGEGAGDGGDRGRGGDGLAESQAVGGGGMAANIAAELRTIEGGNPNRIAGNAPQDPFEFLRNQPQFLQMRSLVYQNPDLLQAVLQQIGQTNPALLQLISENQDAFLNMLNQPMEGQAVNSAQYMQRLTPGRRAQLAAAARTAAGGDGLHVRPSSDITSGAGGDAPANRSRPGESGDAGSDPVPRGVMPPRTDRSTERHAPGEAYERERAAAAAAVAALTAAASAAVDRDVGGGDGTGDGAGTGSASVPPRNNPHVAATPFGGDSGGVATFRLTPQDQDAIERLKALGFPETLVLQAYFACEKDEQLAANFLISSAFDD